ncbi:MAG: hypothetical protein PVF83_03875 [Anaerolineales bacterium]|jgi:hypothetical protein
MSGVHINLIVGNQENVQHEDRDELEVVRKSISHKEVDRSDDILEIIVKLPESLEETVAEKIKKEKEGMLE